MTWLFLTLGAQFLFALGAHVDKYLLSRYFRGGAPGALILYSALFSFVVLPAAAAIEPDVLALDAAEIGMLLLGGALNIGGVVLSLYAMQRDEASVVATLFQLVPVFSYALAWAILGETLTAVQIAAALLIMAGAVLVALDLRQPRVAIKGRVLALMALASAAIATNAVLFKRVAVANDFWASTFWSYASLALVGVASFTLVRPYRAQFLHTLCVNRGPVIAINVGNELLAAAGYVMISYATLLVPVALVAVTSGFQPTMVFLLGVLITRLAPRLGREELTRAILVQKGVAMAAIVAGVWMLEGT